MKKLSGIIIEKGALGNACKLDLTGMIGKMDRIPVNINYDPCRLVGHAKCHNTPEGLMAEINIVDGVEFNKMYPVIDGVVKKSHFKDGVRYIDEFQITSVSISVSRNADHSIKSIGEQNEQ